MGAETPIGAALPRYASITLLCVSRNLLITWWWLPSARSRELSVREPPLPPARGRTGPDGLVSLLACGAGDRPRLVGVAMRPTAAPLPEGVFGAGAARC